MFALRRSVQISTSVVKSSFETIFSGRQLHLSNTRMSKKVLMLLAPGFEEAEFVCTYDVLRRCGLDVTVAGVKGKDPIPSARNVLIQVDQSVEDASKNIYDAVAMPGGLENSQTLAASKVVGEILKKHESEGKVVAAICAAPTVLKAHSIGLGKTITSYPAMKDQLADKYKYVSEIVVQDGNIITSQGPATSFAYGAKIAEALVGSDKVKQVQKDMLLI